MKVALFIPCYIDQFYPQVGIATLQLLKKLGCEVDYPKNQTCCGQPMANSGMESYSKGTAKVFIKAFEGYDYIVSPSGSCVLHVKEHFNQVVQTEGVQNIRNNVMELCEFLYDVIKVKELASSFPYKVGLHQGCHGQRGLNLSSHSELNQPEFSKITPLLEMVKGLQIINLDRKDECCGFGGTFCVSEDVVSARMGSDRVADHFRNGVEVITGSDMSCLMHLEGIVKRKRLDIRVLHIAEILNGKTNY